MFNSITNFNYRLVFLLMVSIGLTACGGGGGSSTPATTNNVSSVVYPDCSTGSGAYSGCWTTENCIAGAVTDTGTTNPNYSSRSLIQFHETATTPSITGKYDIYGMAWDNATCSGKPVKVGRVNPFNFSYIQKADHTCVSTGGTTLSPASDCNHLAILLLDKNNVPVTNNAVVDIFTFITNGVRLCNNEGLSIDRTATSFAGTPNGSANPNAIDLGANACLSRFAP